MSRKFNRGGCVSNYEVKRKVREFSLVYSNTIKPVYSSQPWDSKVKAKMVVRYSLFIPIKLIHQFWKIGAQAGRCIQVVVVWLYLCIELCRKVLSHDHFFQFHSCAASAESRSPTPSSFLTSDPKLIDWPFVDWPSRFRQQAKSIEAIRRPFVVTFVTFRVGTRFVF